jgi:hypothetical protein
MGRCATGRDGETHGLHGYHGSEARTGRFPPRVDAVGIGLLSFQRTGGQLES